MAVKVYKPTTPARRQTSVVDYGKILKSTSKSPRKLFKSKAKSAGRNAHGKITVRHRGGGFKKVLREVDFKLDKFDIPGKVQNIEYDAGRTAFVCLVAFADGEKRYVLAPEGVQVGDQILTSKTAPIKSGNRLPLNAMPVGTIMHNVELQPGNGGKLARSAGGYVTLQAIDGDLAILKMASGEVRYVSSKCWATVGQASNAAKANVRIGKAGRRRLMGWRPSVRGKAMNPVDHPHGGGEGNTPIGLKHPKTKWGKRARGVKTRKSKKYSNSMIIKRRK